jgi:hypothetical protein
MLKSATRKRWRNLGKCDTFSPFGIDIPPNRLRQSNRANRGTDIVNADDRSAIVNRDRRRSEAPLQAFFHLAVENLADE